ncbi:MAG: hypothetical protein ACOYNC_09085 [Bacteroidales bacterium]
MTTHNSLKTPSLNELKRELINLPPAELVKICLQLAKHKKENKELMGYLLFDSNYEPEYIEKVKLEIDQLFAEINKNTLYFVKKSVRKILRTVNKHIRYSGLKQTEVELRIYFCIQFRQCGIPLSSSTALTNIFEGQLLKIQKALSGLHEDLQHDYGEEIKRI